MSFLIQINSVTLQKSHVRITRNPDEDDPPFTTQNLQLWTKDGKINGDTNPATIPLGGANLIVNIASPNSENFEFQVCATVENRFIGESAFVTYAAGTASMDMIVPTIFSPCPWGSTGTITWTFKVSFGSQNWISPYVKTPVQLYAIASEIAPMYGKGGIPKDILDLFVDEYTDNGSSVEAWVTWAVTRCHASKKDPVIQAAKVAAIHNYTYSNYGGGAMFTSGRTFDLPRWLKSRETASVLSTVNCYDQAALVICVLSLGLPYYLRDQDGKIVMEKITGDDKPSEVTTLQRFGLGTWNNHDVWRFGFIKETDLVGWGQCNNPFFGPKDGIPITAPDDKERTSFANHIFVRYNTLGSQGVAVQHALDACAGPIANPIPLQTYLEKVIDQPPSQARGGPNWSLGGGMETLLPTDTIQNLSLFKLGLETDPKDSLAWMALIRAQGSRTVPASPINASLTDLFSSIPNVVTSKPDTYIVKDHSCISVEFSHPGDPTPFAAATIDVMMDFNSAKLQARSRIAHLDRGWEDVFAVPTEAQYLGDVNMVAQPDTGIVILVYSNISIWLDGSVASQPEFDALVESIDTYMSAAKKSVLTAKPDTDFTISSVGTVTIGVPFQITITAPGVEEMEVDSESNIVHITKGPVPQANNSGVYVIDCMTFEEGSDQLIFGFAEGGTFFPNTNKLITITSVPSPNPLAE